MAALSLPHAHRSEPGPASPPVRSPLTLAGEHALLLRQVTTRAARLLTAAAAGRWPGAELAALVDYARAELLRQAAEEEALLSAAGPAEASARLARDHVRLRSGIDLLARAAAGEQPLSAAQLAAATRDFVSQLERHLHAEHRLLAASRVPATAASLPRGSGTPAMSTDDGGRQTGQLR